MKIITVIGARPQFIKAGALSRELRKEHEEILVHTGQHYDENMSDIFFKELDIPYPDYNLGISGGSHAQMTARMLVSIEEVLIKEKCDALLVYGDTNSTLAATLAAVKLQIPIIHVEAAARLGTLTNPEEVNRIVTDHLSSVLFACVPSALEFAKQEGLTENIYLVGDPMFDAFLYYKNKKTLNQVSLKCLSGERINIPSSFNYMTIHRQENTQESETLKSILDAMESFNNKTIYPVHPRNQNIVRDIIKEDKYKNILFVEPVGYLDSITLVNNSIRIVTDSGGVQREAFFAQKPCVTVFDYVVWPETMINNCNQLSKPITEEIISKFDNVPYFDKNYMPFGNGDACVRICDVLRKIKL